MVPANRRLSRLKVYFYCRLNVKGALLKTSEIAEYQGALRLRPHRTSPGRLVSSERDEGTIDRRNVVCTSSQEKGVESS